MVAFDADSDGVRRLFGNLHEAASSVASIVVVERGDTGSNGRSSGQGTPDSETTDGGKIVTDQDAEWTARLAGFDGR